MHPQIYCCAEALNGFSSVTDGKAKKTPTKDVFFVLSHWPDSAALISLAH